ncbi:MAG: tRNA (adenosine(37)-N6)-threonylcarbamoyltransferase complex transferase subunit TsaD [Candidatus Pacebacteria bacterium]|nr:tRNA (adenosine(37)-N6)-threonylcarbamoyltransferase complex transferase subunit TsaD [Candidatus Paceibacterota bacterium]
MNNEVVKILAIETSCDETAIALLACTNQNDTSVNLLGNISILGNTVSSQAQLHAEFGGVYPALAKREHAKNIVPVLIDTLNQAGLQTDGKYIFTDEQKTYLKNLFNHEPELYENFINDLPAIENNKIDSIAITTGPGLEPALWVGINFAKALNYIWGVPLTPVNHMEGHILSPLLSPTAPESSNKFELPALALLISGGHTEIVYVPELGVYQKIGQTLDDAVGEAFDKVARLLGLPYPGGPQISKLAQIDRLSHAKATLDLPKPMLHSGDLNMSFSGLKTAVLYMVQKLKEASITKELSDEQKQNIARSFEDSVTEVLVKKVLKAIEQYGGDESVKTILVGGGVSANTFIKQNLTNAVQKYDANISVIFPESELSTDNAIMIGMVGALKSFGKNQIKNSDIVDAGELVANSNWSF